MNRYLVFPVIQSDAAFAIMLQKSLECVCLPGTEFQMLIYSSTAAWFWWFCQVAGQNYDFFAVKRMPAFATPIFYAVCFSVIAV